MKKHLADGIVGENIATSFYKRKGYLILERNWKFSRAEIDLICLKDQVLVFCEVKTRNGSFFGNPETFVRKRKKQLIVDAAVNYMIQSAHEGEFRFDIVGILLKSDHEYAIRHFPDAFFPGIEGFM